jgi:multidrug efflux pump
MAALFGALPLALGTGVGSELRRRLALPSWAVSWSASCWTLYTTPVVYLYLDRMRLRFLRRQPHRVEAQTGPSIVQSGLLFSRVAIRY